MIWQYMEWFLSWFWLGRILLESRGWRPKIFLNILECTVQLPTTKNYSAWSINSAKVEKPWSACTFSKCMHYTTNLKHIFLGYVLMVLFVNQWQQFNRNHWKTCYPQMLKFSEYFFKVQVKITDLYIYVHVLM